MRAINLRTEYLKDPIGIDMKGPRLTWNCEGGIKQTAYRIVTEKWDSGKTDSSSMSAVYPEDLESRERVTWKICLWDENGVPGEWSEGFFEMGLLDKKDWKAVWITGDYTVNKKGRYPVDCFRKMFETMAEVKSARMYITACGLYEAKLNGSRVGDFFMAPGHTDYRKRIQCQTYDVTELVKQGGNELTVQLADGWYRGSTGAWGLTNQYGTETKLLCQLEIGILTAEERLFVPTVHGSGRMTARSALLTTKTERSSRLSALLFTADTQERRSAGSYQLHPTTFRSPNMRGCAPLFRHLRTERNFSISDRISPASSLSEYRLM